MEHLLALLAECPEGFAPVRDGCGTLLGFTCVIPVEPRLLPLLTRFAVTARYLDHLAATFIAWESLNRRPAG